jgi:hypothetical protein
MSAPMKAYLFYVNHDDRAVSDLHITMCVDDDGARAHAEGLLGEQPERCLIEICEGERMVANVRRPPQGL